jgi:hypothetical protein
MANKRSIVEILINAKDSTANAFRSAGAKLSGLKEQIFSMKAAVAAFAAFVIEKIGHELVDAFAKHEAAIISLNTALRVTGRYSEDGTRAIQAMSEQMQELTTVSADAATQVSATVAQLAMTLTPDQLARVQQAAIGLSQTFGMDLQTAAILAGKAISGEKDVLARYNISLDNASTEQERFNLLMKKTAPLFEVAKGSAQSLLGQLDQTKNAWEDEKTVLGGVVVQMLGLDKQGHSLRDMMKDLVEWTKAHTAAIVKWGRVLGDALYFQLQISGLLIHVFFDLGRTIIDTLILALDALPRFFVFLGDKLVDGMNVLIGKINEHLPDMLKLTLIDHASNPIANGVRDTWTAAIDQIKNNFSDIGTSIDNVKDAYHDMRDDMKKPVDAKVIVTATTAGGGKNLHVDPSIAAERAAKELIAQAGVLVAKQEAGLIGGDEFNQQADTMVKKLYAIKDAGGLVDDTMIQLGQAIKGVNGHMQDLSMVASPHDNFMQAFRKSTVDAYDMILDFDTELANTTMNTLQSFGQEATAAFGQLTKGGKDAGKAFESAMIDAIGSVADGFAQLFAARAVAELAAGIATFPAGAHHFAAAGEFFAAAALMGAIGGAIHGAASRAGGGGGGGGPQDVQNGRNDAAANQPPDATVVIQGGLLDMSDPRQAEALAGAIGELSGRRVIIKQG